MSMKTSESVLLLATVTGWIFLSGGFGRAQQEQPPDSLDCRPEVELQLQCRATGPPGSRLTIVWFRDSVQLQNSSVVSIQEMRNITEGSVVSVLTQRQFENNLGSYHCQLSLNGNTSQTLPSDSFQLDDAVVNGGGDVCVAIPYFKEETQCASLILPTPSEAASHTSQLFMTSTTQTLMMSLPSLHTPTSQTPMTSLPSLHTSPLHTTSQTDELPPSSTSVAPWLVVIIVVGFAVIILILVIICAGLCLRTSKIGNMETQRDSSRLQAQNSSLPLHRSVARQPFANVEYSEIPELKNICQQDSNPGLVDPMHEYDAAMTQEGSHRVVHNVMSGGSGGQPQGSALNSHHELATKAYLIPTQSDGVCAVPTQSNGEYVVPNLSDGDYVVTNLSDEEYVVPSQSDGECVVPTNLGTQNGNLHYQQLKTDNQEYLALYMTPDMHKPTTDILNVDGHQYQLLDATSKDSLGVYAEPAQNSTLPLHQSVARQPSANVKYAIPTQSDGECAVPTQSDGEYVVPNLSDGDYVVANLSDGDLVPNLSDGKYVVPSLHDEEYVVSNQSDGECVVPTNLDTQNGNLHYQQLKTDNQEYLALYMTPDMQKPTADMRNVDGHQYQLLDATSKDSLGVYAEPAQNSMLPLHQSVARQPSANVKYSEIPELKNICQQDSNPDLVDPMHEYDAAMTQVGSHRVVHNGKEYHIIDSNMSLSGGSGGQPQGSALNSHHELATKAYLIPIQSDGERAVPSQSDGDYVVPNLSDGDYVVPNLSDGKYVVPGLHDEEYVVSNLSDGECVVPTNLDTQNGNLHYQQLKTDNQEYLALYMTPDMQKPTADMLNVDGHQYQLLDATSKDSLGVYAEPAQNSTLPLHRSVARQPSANVKYSEIPELKNICQQDSNPDLVDPMHEYDAAMTQEGSHRVVHNVMSGGSGGQPQGSALYSHHELATKAYLIPTQSDRECAVPTQSDGEYMVLNLSDGDYVVPNLSDGDYVVPNRSDGECVVPTNLGTQNGNLHYQQLKTDNQEYLALYMTPDMQKPTADMLNVDGHQYQLLDANSKDSLGVYAEPGF